MAPVTLAQKVAAGIFVVLVVLTWIYFSISIEGTPSGQKFYILFDEAVKGLTPSSLTYYNGIPIGKVTKISNEFGTNQVRVEILITEKGVKIFGDLKTSEGVKPGTRALLVRYFVTGIQYIDMTGGSAEHPLLTDGSVIPSEPLELQKWAKNADKMLGDVQVILENIEAATSPERLAPLYDTLSNLALLSENVNKHLSGDDPHNILWRLNKIMDNLERLTGEENRAYIAGILRNAEKITDQDTAQWSLLLKDLQRQFSQLSQSAQGLLEDLRKFIDSNGTREDLTSLVEKVGSLLEENRKNLGRILADFQRISSAFGDQASVLSKDVHHVLQSMNYLLSKEFPQTNRQLQKSLRELDSLLKVLKAKPNALLWGSDVKGQ